MNILLHKNFLKHYRKLSVKQQEKVNETIDVFANNPHDPELRNHPLHGEKKGFRSISVGGDLRIIFRERNNYQEVLLLEVGTHSQLY